jgi:hypothetical protein
MLITIITPQAILGKAWGDMDDANSYLKKLQLFAEEDDVLWSITHA